MTEEEKRRLQEQQAAVASIPAQEQPTAKPYEADFMSVVNAQRGGSWPTPVPTIPAPIRPETNMQELQKKRTDELLAQEQAAKRAEATAPATTTLDDVYSQLMKAQMEAQQKESAELRRHGRTQQMIGGITDAANALASMYNATRGAAPTYDPRASLEGKALARYDRAKTEMDKNHAQQMAYIRQLRADAMAGENAKTARERLQYMRDRETRLAQEAQNKAAYQQEVLRLRREKQELDALLADRKIDLDDYKAKTGRLNAESRQQAAKYGLQDYEIIYRYDEYGNMTGQTRHVLDSGLRNQESAGNSSGSGSGKGKAYGNGKSSNKTGSKGAAYGNK